MNILNNFNVLSLNDITFVDIKMFNVIDNQFKVHKICTKPKF